MSEIIEKIDNLLKEGIRDGKLKMFSGQFPSLSNFRKRKVKSIDDAILKL